jgi:hypothetical protein
LALSTEDTASWSGMPCKLRWRMSNTSSGVRAVLGDDLLAGTHDAGLNRDDGAIGGAKEGAYLAGDMGCDSVLCRARAVSTEEESCGS